MGRHRDWRDSLGIHEPKTHGRRHLAKWLTRLNEVIHADLTKGILNASGDPGERVRGGGRMSSGPNSESDLTHGLYSLDHIAAA